MKAPQVLNPADVQPFATTNALLAYCLYKAGVPWADPQQPCFNTYTAASLFELGGGERNSDGAVTKPSIFAGMSDEQAAKRAFEMKRKGKVEYLFRMTPELSGLLAEYTDIEREFKEAEAKAEAIWTKERKITAEIHEIPLSLSRSILAEFNAELDGPAEMNRILLRLAYIERKTSADFVAMWKMFPPIVKRDNPGKAQVEDCMITVKDPATGTTRSVPGKQVVTPGCKMWSVNISDAKRRKLGLK